MDAQKITYGFITVLAVILIFGFVVRLAKKRSNKIIDLLPNVAVTLGILGTFVGIYVGLLGFDVAELSESIPKLLEGMKTAFATSIAGIIVSVILKFTFEGKAVREESKSEVKTEDPIDLLKAVVEGISNLEKSSKEIEKSIVSCFRSEEEYSLISQLKLIRQEIADSRREVTNSFKEFADKIAESSTDALVKALEKVIGDFNVLLNELVSESFKELSAAMVKLTEWQENYKVYVDETQNNINVLLSQMKDSVDLLESSSKRIAQIDGSLESIDSSISSLSVSAEDIASHIENLKLQNEVMKESMASIKNIGEDARKVLPTITEQINDLTNKLETTVSNVTDRFDTTSTHIEEFVEKSVKEINEATEKQMESIQRSIDGIDKGLEEELTRALNTLAGHLASLSEKFVEDYLPLTEKLREIVRIPEKIDA